MICLLCFVLPRRRFFNCKYASLFISVASSINIRSKTPFAGVIDLTFSGSSSPQNKICFSFNVQVIIISDLLIEKCSLSPMLDIDFVTSLNTLRFMVLPTLRQHSQLQPFNVSRTILSVIKKDFPDEEPPKNICKNCGLLKYGIYAGFSLTSSVNPHLPPNLPELQLIS